MIAYRAKLLEDGTYGPLTKVTLEGDFIMGYDLGGTYCRCAHARGIYSILSKLDDESAVQTIGYLWTKNKNFIPRK